MLKVILRIFLHLLDKYFAIYHKYYNIFSRNNVKISYNCIDSVKNLISGHNKEITNFYNKINGKTFNCSNKNNCPLDNKC